MKRLVQHWYQWAVYVAGLLTVILVCGDWTLLQQTLLASLVVLHLHFYEEMGFPGGFPWIGMKIELHLTDDDSRQWDLNQASSFFGNEWFAVVVYLLPLFVPQVHFLALAAVIFAFAEIAMHLFYFNWAMKVWYNPGLLTALLGLLPISVNYLWRAIPQGQYSWLDLVMAVIWIAFNYWVAFRSPIYKKLGSLKQYSFTTEEVNRAQYYMKKMNKE